MAKLMTDINGKFRPLGKGVVVRGMQFGDIKTAGGIIVPDDDAQLRGIHPRWGQVVVVGEKQTDVEPGQWVLVAHGRWSRGFKLNGEEVRTVDPNDILAISDEEVTPEWTPPTGGHESVEA